VRSGDLMMQKSLDDPFHCARVLAKLIDTTVGGVEIQRRR